MLIEDAEPFDGTIGVLFRVPSATGCQLNIPKRRLSGVTVKDQKWSLSIWMEQ
jgi:hypothetical protein